jgi:hypothetical protein
MVERDKSHMVKVKVKVKVNSIIYRATKAHMGRRSTALLFFNLGSRWSWVIATSRPLYPLE